MDAEGRVIRETFLDADGKRVDSRSKGYSIVTRQYDDAGNVIYEAYYEADRAAVRLEGGTSTGQVEGVLLREFGYVPLTLEAAEQLKSGDVSQIRVLGKNTSYDLNVNMNIDQTEKIVEACETLISE